jgi:hypothetical protein
MKAGGVLTMEAALVIVMTCLVILLLAKLRVPGSEEGSVIVFTRNRDEAVRTDTTHGAWVFVLILLFLVFLIVVLPR